MRPVAVGVIHTKKSAQWVYREAWRRVTLEAALMLTVVGCSTSERPIHYKLVKQEAMAKTVGIPLPTLHERAKERWGEQVPKYQKDRFPAVVGAIALAEEFCA